MMLPMAGGPHAKLIPCMVCLDDRTLTRATRTREEVESDQYRSAEEPQWPPPEELVRYCERE